MKNYKELNDKQITQELKDLATYFVEVGEYEDDALLLTEAARRLRAAEAEETVPTIFTQLDGEVKGFKSIYVAIQDGHIPARMSGKTPLVTMAAVRASLKAGTQETARRQKESKGKQNKPVIFWS